jgi:hypothetical protein
MGRHASLAKSVTQPSAPSRLAALDRSDRPAQVASCLLVAATLEVTQDKWGPEMLGKPVDLFMKGAFKVVVMNFDPGFRPQGRPAPLMPAPSSRGKPSGRRSSKGNLVEPRPK